MGATNFVDVVWTDGSASDGYSHLYNEALNEHGHDGYNGTISTTSGHTVVTTQPMTASGAGELAGWAFDRPDRLDRSEARFIPSKWEDALAIPILSDNAFTFRKESMVLTLDDLDPDLRSSVVCGHSRIESAFSDMARDAAIRKFGPALHSVTAEVVSVKHTVSVIPAEGKQVTMYAVGGGRDTQRFAKKSDAVAYAKKVLESGRGYESKVDIRIVKVFQKQEPQKELGTGSPGSEVAVVAQDAVPVRPTDETVAVSVTRRVKSARVKVTITVAQPKKAVSGGRASSTGGTPTYMQTAYYGDKQSDGVRAGWLFYGWAAC